MILPLAIHDLLSNDPGVLGFDPDALRARYARERARRLRADGMQQYIRAEERLSARMNDPYTPSTPREPVVTEADVLIVGGGFGGLLAAAYLRKAGIDDFYIVEAGGDFGGTWYWNRYPNAQCDTESYIYLPLLEECGYIPSRNYAYAPEIFAHAQRIGHTFDLYPHALFHTELDRAEWNEDAARWHMVTDRGDDIRARHLILANGGLMRAKLPRIPGLNQFKGHAFHTSRWDYGYTGGDSQGNLSGLADKRVGIIGTGATAIQCVPPLGASAKELYVFQRTPSTVGIRDNQLTAPDFTQKLTPGWQRRRAETFVAAIEGQEYDEHFPGDSWIDLMTASSKALRALRAAGYPLGPDGVAQVTENADFEKMERIRARVRSIVKDEATAELLQPYYRPLCKRPCFHDEYLDTFNRPNVHLVDAADGGGVERFTPEGIVVAGREYPLDCVIFATGFETTPTFAPNSGFEVIGRDGLSLGEKWRDGFVTMFGYTTAGFPNCYFMTRTQAPLPQNIPTLLEEAADHVAYLISQVKQRGIRALDTSPEGEQRWQDEMERTRRNGFRYHSQCTPGYFNNEGQLSAHGHSFFAGLYGGGTIAFFDLIRKWRADNALEGLSWDYADDGADTAAELAAPPSIAV